jgi:hypothetical protein
MYPEAGAQMSDEVVDYEARGATKGVKQLIESHERVDEERFGQLREEIKDMKVSFAALDVKMDAVKELIGSRPSWTVMMIISSMAAIIGFLAARQFPA